VIPENAVIDATAFIETTYSFHLYRSREPLGLRVGRGATVYAGTMFDIGPRGRVSIGAYTLVNGARIICDAEVEIGDYGFISWNVVFMDTYRAPLDPVKRQRELMQAPFRDARVIDAAVPAKPIHIDRNVWIGFDACVMPGVTIGEGSIVGARSVVFEDVPPYTVVAGNPSRVIRRLEMEEIKYNEY
jgi:acetyltransferase-like isoleucine patch superfamily enzyme